jgi:hypothetical protein
LIELQALSEMQKTALTALLSHMPPSAAFAVRPDKHAEEVAHGTLASEAYRWAEAMLKAQKSVTGPLPLLLVGQSIS